MRPRGRAKVVPDGADHWPADVVGQESTPPP